MTSEKYFLKHPGEQRFYNVMAFFMSLAVLNSGYWKFYVMPDRWWMRLHRFLIPISIPMAFVSQVFFLYQKYSQLDLSTLIVIYTVLPVTFILVVKSTISHTSSYKTAMTEFLEEIHIYSYYCKHNEPYVEEVLIRAEKYIRWSFYILGALILVCGSTFIVVPIIHNVQNNASIHNITSPLETLLHFWVPFDYEYDFCYWVIFSAVTTYCVIFTGSVIVLFDVANLAFLYHLIGHIEILKHILKYDFKEKNVSEEEIKRKLIGLSQYYQFIRRIFKDVENAFGLNIVAHYLHNLVGGGLIMFQIMSSGADTEILLSYGLMIPIYMGELIVIALVLEKIRIQSNEIPALVYDIPWESMTLANQKLILMILFQVQPILEFKAAFNVKTGIQPALNIIKTTFSYYVMIKARM